MESGAVAAKDRAVQDGLRYLQRTQLEDGTWHVRRRAFPFQPPMDSGFPHGADGWISGAATSWAILALATAMDPLEVFSVPPGVLATSKLAAPSGEKFVQASPSRASARVDFARDIQPILERSCVSCHSGERAKGGFVMDSRESLLKGGNRGEAAVVVNHSEQSPLLQFVSDQIEDVEMPPVGKRDKFPPLTEDEVARLRSWIDRGAAWPENVTLRPPTK
jgi:cob(I)alamin adenosyltransferase